MGFHEFALTWPSNEMLTSIFWTGCVVCIAVLGALRLEQNIISAYQRYEEEAELMLHLNVDLEGRKQVNEQEKNITKVLTLIFAALSFASLWWSYGSP